MNREEDLLFDEVPGEDAHARAIEELADVVRRFGDPLSLADLGEMLCHRHGAVRKAAEEALVAMRPSALSLRRQLRGAALRRARSVLGHARTRKTKRARAVLAGRGR